MIGPCKKCVVQPTCTEVCPEKENDGTFLTMGLREINNGIRSFALQGRQVPKTIIEQKALQLYKISCHETDISELRNRGASRPYKDEHKPHRIPIVRRK